MAQNKTEIAANKFHFSSFLSKLNKRGGKQVKQTAIKKSPESKKIACFGAKEIPAPKHPHSVMGSPRIKLLVSNVTNIAAKKPKRAALKRLKKPVNKKTPKMSSSQGSMKARG